MNKTKYIRTLVKTWYLKYALELLPEMDNCGIELWNKPDVKDYLNLYRLVGAPWGWAGRLLMSADAMKVKLDDASNEVWLFKVKHEIKGFFEIDFSIIGKAEIVYLGLVPSAIGQGYGRLLLNGAIATAGRMGAEVWLHTCEFDHPNALKTYIKAGFELINEKIEEEYYPVEFLKRMKRN